MILWQDTENAAFKDTSRTKWRTVSLFSAMDRNTPGAFFESASNSGAWTPGQRKTANWQEA